MHTRHMCTYDTVLVKSPTLRHLSCIKTFKQSKQIGGRKCLANQTRHSSYLPFTEYAESITIFNISVEAGQHAGNQKQDFYNTFICTEKCTNTDMHTTDRKQTDKTHAQHILHASLLKHFWWRLSEFSVNMHALWLKHLSFPLVLYHTVLHSACSCKYRPRPIIITPHVWVWFKNKKK